MTGGQIRAARSLIRWTAERLAEASGVGIATIKRAEASDDVVRMIPANAAAVQTALEAAGVEFIPENGGGAGVRLRKGSETGSKFVYDDASGLTVFPPADDEKG